MAGVDGPVTLRTDVGSVQVTDVRGEVSIRANEGPLEISWITGSVRAATGSGDVAVRRSGRKITTLTAGDVVGELSLLDHGPRTATAICEGDCTLFVLDQRHFRAALEGSYGNTFKNGYTCLMTWSRRILGTGWLGEFERLELTSSVRAAQRAQTYENGYRILRNALGSLAH